MNLDPGESGEPFGLRESLRLVRARAADPDLEGYDPLDALVSVCADTIPAADAAAISHAGPGWVRSTHGTDPAIEDMDRWQCEFGQGPLLDQALAPRPYRSVAIVNDLVLDTVVDGTTVEVGAPFRALHTTTLRHENGHRTSLDLYARDRRAFDQATTVLADMFAIRATRQLYGRDDTELTGQQIAAQAVTGSSLSLPPTLVQALLETRLLHGLNPLFGTDEAGYR